MKWLLLLLLGASLANAQKKCLANFHGEERSRCELYGEQAGLQIVIDDTQNVVGKCNPLDRPRSVILKRNDVKDHSWVFTTKNPKKSYGDMMKFLTSQSTQIDGKHKMTLTYKYKTRDGKARSLQVKSDMDLWAAFLLQGRYSNVELFVNLFTGGPTAVPTTGTPTAVPTTAQPTSFNSGVVNSEEDMTWLQDQIKGLGAKMWGNPNYRMTRDGKASSVFRTKAAYKGPSMFLVKSKKGNIFGAYIDITWTATATYFYCDKCFLWIIKDGKYTYKTLPIYRYSNYATYHHTSYGPCFGGAHDFCINSPTSPYGYTSSGYTYKAPTGGYPYYFQGSSTFYIAEWEMIPVGGINPEGFFSYIITSKEDQAWLNAQLPTGKRLGQRCYRMEGLGKAKYGSMSYYRDSCANKGPIMLVIKSTTNHIFGGYTGMSWCTNTCGYKASTTAFLWILKDKKYEKKKLLQPGSNSTKTYATYHHTSYGPCFGGAHDLCINSPGSKKGYANIGYTYKSPSGSYPWYMTTSSNGFTMTDWEVFFVKDKK